MCSALYVGAISGTSVDGLDLALLHVDDEALTIEAAHTEALPGNLRRVLIDLAQRHGDHLDALGHADTALGQFIGQSINEFLARCKVRHEDIAAIGSHGQTVRHRPDGTQPFTMQIGDPNCIAETTGVLTVADFRRRDLAAGGQAAPLVPPFHAALFACTDESRAIANIGGISNITVLAPGTPVTGFDTGPGNALLDAWYQQHNEGAYDENGTWAAGGVTLQALLDALLQDPYLSVEPPKSTGKEHYNLEWLQPKLSPLEPQDVQRTLSVFTARSLADAVERWAPATARVLVCGGGRLNQLLMADLAGALACPVEPVEEHGIDGDAVEAAAFAWLAHRRLTGQPGNEPSVTGAAAERVLGGVYSP
ncbi:MAG: anhydro-N-acetylmuramic acid kinase [Pseudomonadales bacterium]|jgi:anhydro-N-acetylmuramic acid kinase|nr:anhydro-N-acetylmuramic acid kinase [Pseudomonadales bacterium]MDP6970044.1 anhydro-N-acetylmuramic acid kinase [Pseudomonadales bacterium]|tara:strand:- start:1134 stop:2228 length:1095 start_codon:yes stop_codon:yes gene_type:complete